MRTCVIGTEATPPGNATRRAGAMKACAIEREGRKLVARVVSPDFAGVADHVRQEQIWRMILDNFSDAEQAQVGFVFTETPEEMALARARAASSA